MVLKRLLSELPRSAGRSCSGTYVGRFATTTRSTSGHKTAPLYPDDMSSQSSASALYMPPLWSTPGGAQGG